MRLLLCLLFVVLFAMITPRSDADDEWPLCDHPDVVYVWTMDAPDTVTLDPNWYTEVQVDLVISEGAFAYDQFVFGGFIKCWPQGLDYTVFASPLDAVQWYVDVDPYNWHEPIIEPTQHGSSDFIVRRFYFNEAVPAGTTICTLTYLIAPSLTEDSITLTPDIAVYCSDPPLWDHCSCFIGETIDIQVGAPSLPGL